jgi:peroxiredoxin
MVGSRTVMRTIILAVIFIGIGAALYSQFIKDKAVVKIGSEAPDFVLPTLSGDQMQLSEFRGKGIVLNFWGTWCTPCIEEMPALQVNYQKYKEQGVVIIGVHIGGSKVTVESFTNRYQLTFPIAMDRSREITQLYEVGQIPSTYFIDQNGIVKTNVVGGPMSEEAINENILQIVPE